MRRITALLVFAAFAATAADTDFNGRWNIKPHDKNRNRAWWLEVTGAGTPDLKGRFVGAPGGSMDVIPEISISGGELTFVFVREPRPDSEDQRTWKGTWRARVVKERLEGTFVTEGGSAAPIKWTGWRAPVITDKDDGTWREGKPVSLFNGKDLSNWLPMDAGRPLGWSVKDGIMVNEAKANNLVSKEKFWNFKLHAEYRLGERTNGGIGLRGRYEVQVLQDYGRPVTKQSNGALYSRIVPTKNASKPAGEWQTFDITMIGRTVTVVLNGETIIDKKEVEGLTAMGHDPDEAKPGPISLQGDHGVVEFRKLDVTPLVK